MITEGNEACLIETSTGKSCRKVVPLNYGEGLGYLSFIKGQEQ